MLDLFGCKEIKEKESPPQKTLMPNPKSRGNGQRILAGGLVLAGKEAPPPRPRHPSRSDAHRHAEALEEGTPPSGGKEKGTMASPLDGGAPTAKGDARPARGETTGPLPHMVLLWRGGENE